MPFDNSYIAMPPPLMLMLDLLLLKQFSLWQLGLCLGLQSNNHRNISELLDNLLRGYDNSVRPNFGGSPAIVEVDIMVRSMGPISEVDMTYSMDCYFRQSWVDTRLAFEANKETLALSISMLKRIWKPDTYFYNGKHSYLHTITTPNKFVRLYQDGRVLYSSRLTIKAGCPMNLEDFPMDTQRCPLKFGSFGYTRSDVVYTWNRQRQVAIAEDMKLSQFDLIATPSANQTDALPPGEYSMLLVSFHLQRHMGNFLIQVYGPCVLLVVLSWVSFWLNREATADRVSLGITTVLTMTFLGLEARTDLPKVPYPTALDFFVFLSFGFIFATIIQFAVVHYFTKYGSGECYFGWDLTDSSGSDDETSSHEWPPTTRRPRRQIEPLHKAGAVPSISNQNLEVIPLRTFNPRHYPIGGGHRSDGSWCSVFCFHQETTSTTATATTTTTTTTTPTTTSTPSTIAKKSKIRRFSLRRASDTLKGLRGGSSGPRDRAPRYNSVSKIDRASRVVFPLCFLAINVFYWASYLSRSERIH